MKLVNTVAATAVLAGLGMAGTVGAATLEDVQKKGYVQCGVSQGLPGFSKPDQSGNIVCHPAITEHAGWIVRSAVAAAVRRDHQVVCGKGIEERAPHLRTHGSTVQQNKRSAAAVRFVVHGDVVDLIGWGREQR